MARCSLPGCGMEAVFELWCGPDHFRSTHIAYACAFDRVEVTGILSGKFPSVVWHDVDELTPTTT